MLRADASEKSTKIAYSVIMKSANYPHANLANLAKGASLCPRLSASPSVFNRGKLRAFCDAVFAWLARFAWNKIIGIQSFMREDSGASALSIAAKVPVTAVAPSFHRGGVFLSPRWHLHATAVTENKAYVIQRKCLCVKSGFRRAEGTFPAAPLPSLRFRLRHRTTKGCPCPEASTSDSAVRKRV